MILGWSQLQMGLVAGLALLLLIVGTFAGCESHRADAEQQQRIAVESQLATAVDANTSAIDTINIQKRALDVWRGLGVTPEEAAFAIAAMNDVQRLAGELKAQIDKAKEIDRAKPDCGALLGASVERMCPGIAVGLRRAQDRDENDLGGNSGPRREAAPGRAHEGLRTALPVSRD